MKKLAQAFNTAAQDSNPGSRSRKSTPEPLRSTDSVMVSTSAWHAGSLGSISSHSSHDIFSVKTWLSTLGTVYPM